VWAGAREDSTRDLFALSPEFPISFLEFFVLRAYLFLLDGEPLACKTLSR
jgi:hypothetical protein